MVCELSHIPLGGEEGSGGLKTSGTIAQINSCGPRPELNCTVTSPVMRDGMVWGGGRGGVYKICHSYMILPL